jgi:hypothetical protein
MLSHQTLLLVVPKRYCLSPTTCESRRATMHAGLMRVNKYLRGSVAVRRLFSRVIGWSGTRSKVGDADE